MYYFDDVFDDDVFDDDVFDDDVFDILLLFVIFCCSNDNLIPANNTADIRGARLNPPFFVPVLGDLAAFAGRLTLTLGLIVEFFFLSGINIFYYN